MKKYLVLGIITVLSFGLGNTLLLAANIEAVLDSTDTGSGYVVQDSDTTELFRIRGDGKVGIGTDSPAEALEVTGNIKLSGGSATYKVTNVADPAAAQDVATKAYVDAQGVGCYSKCADSGTTAGGATPSCPGGYSSVDTWSERSGFGQWQWGGMNSNNHRIAVARAHVGTGANGMYINSTYNTHIPHYYFQNPCGGIDNQGGLGHTSFNKLHANGDRHLNAAFFAYNMNAYGSGSGSTSYFNDCTACCAD